MFRYELKSIAIWPFIRISVLINTAVGFVIGILYALFFSAFYSILMSMPGGLGDELGGMPDAPTGLLLVFFPILFAVIGGVFYTLMGLVFVLLYNLFASFAGGFEVDFVRKEIMPQMAPAQPQYYSNYPGYSQPSSSATPPPPPPPPPHRPDDRFPQG